MSCFYLAIYLTLSLENALSFCPYRCEDSPRVPCFNISTSIRVFIVFFPSSIACRKPFPEPTFGTLWVPIKSWFPNSLTVEVKEVWIIWNTRGPRLYCNLIYGFLYETPGVYFTKSPIILYF